MNKTNFINILQKTNERFPDEEELGLTILSEKKREQALWDYSFIIGLSHLNLALTKT